jgi:hypothetical protein
MIGKIASFTPGILEARKFFAEYAADGKKE